MRISPLICFPFFLSLFFFTFTYLTSWLKQWHQSYDDTSDRRSTERSVRWHAHIGSHFPSSWVQISQFPVCTSLTRCNRKLLRCLSTSSCVHAWGCALFLFSWGTGVEAKRKIQPACRGLWEIKHPLLFTGWEAAPRITSRCRRITRQERGLPAPPSTPPPRNHVSIRLNYNCCCLPDYSSSLRSSVCLPSAPSQPPVKLMWNTSNSKIILNWEQVKALENESEVTGYKVSTQSISGFCELSFCRWRWTVCPQVLYKKNRHSQPNVLETNTTSVELALPTDQDYIIQIKPFGDGGEGSSSRQITIPRIPGQWRGS